MASPETIQSNPDILNVEEVDLLLEDYYHSRADEIRTDASERGLDDHQAHQEIRRRLDEPATRVAEAAGFVGEMMDGRLEVSQITGEMSTVWMRRQRQELSQMANGEQQYDELTRCRDYLQRLTWEPGLARQKVEAIRAAREAASGPGDTVEPASEAAPFDVYVQLDAYADSRVEDAEDLGTDTAKIDAMNDDINAAIAKVAPILNSSDNPEVALRSMTPDWIEANSQGMTGNRPAELRAMVRHLQFVAENPEAATEMVRHFEERVAAAEAAEHLDEARGDVERLHGAEALQQTILAHYAGNTSYHIGEKSGFNTNQGKSFNGSQPTAQQFWGSMDFGNKYWRSPSALKVPVEAVAFTPAVETEYRTKIIEPAREARFMRAAKPAVTEQEETGKRDIMITNTETGKQEKMVNVHYSFDTHSFSRLPNVPKYLPTREAIRPGNMAQVSIQLPESVAMKLREHIDSDPNVIRTLADKLIIKAYDGQPGRMDAKTWNDYEVSNGPEGAITRGRGRPPYEDLPEGWQLSIFDLKPGMAYDKAYLPQYPMHDQFDRRTVPAPAQRAA